MFFVLAGLALAPGQASDWQRQEAPYLSNVRQVTADFVRAGEGYFAPDGKMVIFQAEGPPGMPETPEPPGGTPRFDA